MSETTPAPASLPEVQTGVVPITPPIAEVATAASKPRLRWLWRTLTGLVIAGLATLSGYLIFAINDWRTHTAEMEVALEEVRSSAAEEVASRLAIQERLELVQSQLATANERIVDLANEEANATDDRTVLVNYMDAMISCADRRQDIITVLTTPGMVFTDTTPRKYARELVEYCDEIKTDYAEVRDR